MALNRMHFYSDFVRSCHPCATTLVSSIPFGPPTCGAGFENVPTIITLQYANHEIHSEAGSIGFYGNPAERKVEKNPTNSPLSTRITNAGGLYFRRNAVEFHGHGIEPNRFRITFYGISDRPLFTSRIAAPNTFGLIWSETELRFVFQFVLTDLTRANAA